MGEGSGAHAWAEGGGGTSHARTTYCCAFTVTCCPSGSSVVTTFRKGTGGFPTAVTGFPAAISVLVGFHQRWMRAPSAAPTAHMSAQVSRSATPFTTCQGRQAQKLHLSCWLSIVVNRAVETLQADWLPYSCDVDWPGYVWKQYLHMLKAAGSVLTA